MDIIGNIGSSGSALTAVIIGFISFGIAIHLLKIVMKNPGIPSVLIGLAVVGLVYYAAHGGVADMGSVWHNLIHTNVMGGK